MNNQLALTNPFEIARDGDAVLLVAQSDLTRLYNIRTMAQIWRPGEGYGPLTPLQVMFKFLYHVVDTVPPVPWVRPELAERVETTP